MEDEALIAVATEAMLDAIGCGSTVTASDVAGALALLDPERIDLAILDVNLNGEDSAPVAAAARACAVPYLFTTGYGPGPVAAAGSAAPVLPKPYSIAELESALNGLVSR